MIILGATSVINSHGSLFVSAAGPTVDHVLALDNRPGVVLLDLVLADGSTPSVNVSRLLKQNIPVLVYTSGDRPELVREAGRAGAMGMIRKSEPAHRLMDAILGVLNGEVSATCDWAASLESDDSFVSARLTEREQEVLTLYASGETAEHVASLLYISRQTVLDHIRKIRSKYSAADRPAASKIDLHHRAVEDGLLDRY